MRYIFLMLPIFLLSACTENFEDINTNPNGPVAVQPELLFRQVLYGYGNDMGREGFAGGSLLGQHFAMTDFNAFDRHALSSPQEGGDPWPIFYTALRDNETLLDASRTKPSSLVYQGPALVMKAYLAMNLTDIFGDVPYFQAFDGRRNGVVKPTYDAQEDIYNADGGILDNLEQAIAVMDAYQGPIPLNGDILFNGDLEGWVRFANSLRIKALIRISGRQEPGDAIQTIVDGGRYLKSNAENATFDFAASPPNSFPIAEERDGIFNVFLMSVTADEILNGLNDPRIATLYLSTQEDGEFEGIQNGIVGGTAVAANTYARPGTVWRENPENLDFNFMTAWETDFLLAEAAVRGYLDEPGNLDLAEDFYRAGVIKAFEYWNTDLPADYLADGPAALDGSSSERVIEQIITQKWISSIGNVYEGWNEWRRTGFPALNPVAASLNDGLIPTRMPYPSEEQALNFENYSKAAGDTEDNSINVRVWWDAQ